MDSISTPVYGRSWRGGATVELGLAINRSWVQNFKSYSGQKLRNNFGQVVRT